MLCLRERPEGRICPVARGGSAPPLSSSSHGAQVLATDMSRHFDVVAAFHSQVGSQIPDTLSRSAVRRKSRRSSSSAQRASTDSQHRLSNVEGVFNGMDARQKLIVLQMAIKVWV
mmetsp:Transcript_34408/g.81540  ORF Transcript_34408/g.81540 Transcript_34408/m.81540 type:complete len:115 (-) Transcript_34408:1140-1484(-)